MKKILIVALLLGLMAGAVMPALAQESSFTITGNAVLVYTEPRTDSQLIAVISVGATVTVLGPQENGFSKIRIADGREGWGKLGIETSTTSTSTSSGGGVTLMAVDNVRLRDQPSLNGRQLASIGWGDMVTLIGFDTSGNWAQVNFKGIVGWVAYAFFRVVEGNIGAIVGEQPSSTAGSGSTVVALGNVIIREEPRLNARRLTLVGWGDTATFLGFDDTGDWIQVRINGFTGWSAAEWWRDGNGNSMLDRGSATITTVTSTTSTTSAVAQPTTQVPAGASTAQGVVIRALGNVRIRNIPNLSGAEIGNVAWGDQMPVLARDASDLWFLVSFNGVTGWVARDWFEVLSGNVGGLPIQQ